MTFEDTLISQRKLRDFIGRKMASNDFVHINESDEFTTLISKGLLSQGNWRMCYYEEGNTRIPIAPVHTFALMLRDIKRTRVSITRFSYTKEVPIKDLWKILYDELHFLSPAALEESLRISVEHIKREPGESYDFSGEKL